MLKPPSAGFTGYSAIYDPTDHDEILQKEREAYQAILEHMRAGGSMVPTRLTEEAQRLINNHTNTLIEAIMEAPIPKRPSTEAPPWLQALVAKAKDDARNRLGVAFIGRPTLGHPAQIYI